MTAPSETTTCPQCGATVKARGLKNHQRRAHPTTPPDPKDDTRDLYADGWEAGYHRAIVDLDAEQHRFAPAAGLRHRFAAVCDELLTQNTTSTLR